MSRTTHWSLLLLGLLELIFTNHNFVNAHNKLLLTPIENYEPTYQSEHTTTMVYNHAGELTYKVIANHVQYFTNTQITWFTSPIATIFNENRFPTWTMKADHGKLTHDRILYLYGHVQVDILADYSKLKHITTDNAVSHLVT